MKHVHTVRVRLKSGQIATYRYHRQSRRRIYSEPNTPAFEAEVSRLTAGLPSPQKPPGARAPRATRVYFVRALGAGLIKIGKAARPKIRLMELQIGSPDRLELLGTVEDKSGGALEAFLHAQFAKHRAHGEWFKPAPELLSYIEANARGL